MRATESFQGANVGAGTYGPYTIQGGTYELEAHATWGGGNLALQKLLGDGVTWFALGAAITADGVSSVNLAPGQYRIVITTATANYFTLTRIPLE